jgi:hypothetical protein
MRRGIVVLVSLAAPGCAALSGFSDLERVDCVGDCADVDRGPTPIGNADAREDDHAPDADAPVTEDATSPVEDASVDLDAERPRDATSATDTAISETIVAIDATPDTAPVTCPTNAKGSPMIDIDGAYCIDKFEATNAQYAQFMAERGSDYSGQPAYCAWNTSYRPASGWPYSNGRDHHPVVAVDWCDAAAFCKWAGKRLCGKIGGGSNPVGRFGDPAASEWYRACSRAGTQIYPYGNTYVAATCQGEDRAGSKNGTTVAVGTLAACVGGYAGIMDMSGNAFEWEDSCTDYVGPADRCRPRGGSFVASPSFMGCAADLLDSTTARNVGYRDVGIRCCYGP